MISRCTCEFYVLLPLAVSSLEDFSRLDIKTTLTRQLDIENPSNQTFGKNHSDQVHSASCEELLTATGVI